MRARASSSCPERASAAPIVFVACASATFAMRLVSGIDDGRRGQRRLRGGQRTLRPADCLLVVAVAERGQAELLADMGELDMRLLAVQRLQRAFVARNRLGPRAALPVQRPDLSDDAGAIARGCAVLSWTSTSSR